MKTVIITMPMKMVLKKSKYPVQGNKTIEYDGEVAFGINGVLSRIIEPHEKVKLLYIVTRGGVDRGSEYTSIFRKEFDQVTEGKELDISEDTIELNFDPSKDEFEKLTSRLIDAIEENTEIISDFTFGSKPFPFVLLSAINYTEMFKNASLLYLIYSKVEWDVENHPYNPMIYDITSLYYLQKVIGAMEGQDPESARKMLDDFFAL